MAPVAQLDTPQKVNLELARQKMRTAWPSHLNQVKRPHMSMAVNVTTMRYSLSLQSPKKVNDL